jgi:hypothetical protein
LEYFDFDSCFEPLIFTPDNTDHFPVHLTLEAVCLPCLHVAEAEVMAVGVEVAAEAAAAEVVVAVVVSKAVVSKAVVGAAVVVSEAVVVTIRAVVGAVVVAIHPVVAEEGEDVVMVKVEVVATPRENFPEYTREYIRDTSHDLALSNIHTAQSLTILRLWMKAFAPPRTSSLQIGSHQLRRWDKCLSLQRSSPARVMVRRE